MKLSDFDYDLPQELIAQTPIEPRDSSRLLILNRAEGSLGHYYFQDLPRFLEKGDTLVFNNSRVVPARLYGFKNGTEIKVELLLLRRIEDSVWEALVKPGKKLHPGEKIRIIKIASDGINREGMVDILAQGEYGIRTIKITGDCDIDDIGNVPLPPYIHVPLDRPDRYQTVYARVKGSAAAPTAGLHFTGRLLDELQQKGVHLSYVTLHIGLDTFRPVREENPENHRIHSEVGELSEEAASIINETRRAGKRVIAVGTSSVRIIEAASQSGSVKPLKEEIRLFIMPGYEFKSVDSMVTNFHLPKSTLIMLVSAFAGRERILNAYDEAIRYKYRFYSFGDAMMIL
jgi:S-adenosylmethionine:tRNA ribosyltransferase-isomerase